MFPALRESKRVIKALVGFLLFNSLLLLSNLLTLISHLQVTDRILSSLASDIRMPHIAMLDRFFEGLFRLGDMRIGFHFLRHLRMLQCLLRVFCYCCRIALLAFVSGRLCMLYGFCGMGLMLARIGDTRPKQA
jgi:hypothetical protein